MGEDHAFGLPGGPTGGHHQGVAVFDGVAVGSGVGSVVVDHRGGSKLVEEPIDRRSGQAVIHRKHRVAPVPGPVQGIDKRLTGREIDCHQVRHGG
jgi:hypothetical protein